MSADLLVDSTIERVPFDSVPSFSPLFRDYCTGAAALASFFEGDFRSEADRVAAADRAAAYPRDREALADILLQQNERWGADERVRANINKLRAAESVAVVTGQQVGILGGPIYTALKTITTLQLAKQLSEETGRAVVPVFWLEGEDHDFEEIASILIQQDADLTTLLYAPDEAQTEPNGGPVGPRKLTAAIEPVIERLAAALRPTEFKEAVMARVRDAYAPGTTLMDAFARLMRSFFPDTGLVFIDPTDPRLKSLAAPLFSRAVTGAAEAESELRSTSEPLAAAYHAQISVRPVNLFYIDGARTPVGREGDRLTLSGFDEALSEGELKSLVERRPERFGPNVALRPIVQDTLLPTAAYIAGPGEVAYFAQLRPLYAWAGVPMPIIYPRASATIVEGRIANLLERYKLDLAALSEDPDALFQRLVLADAGADLDAQFSHAAKHLDEAVNRVLAFVESVDKSLLPSAEASRTGLHKEWERLRGKVLKAEKRQHDDMRGHIEKVQASLMPGGKLQERALSILPLLTKYGPDLLLRLSGTLSTETTQHQIVHL